MAYGILKADTLTYSTPTGDINLAISGISFAGSALISGVSGIFTTSVSGAAITGNTISGGTVQGVTGIYTGTLSGGTITGGTGNFTTLNAVSVPGFAALSGAQTFTGGQRGAVSVVAFSTGIALDFNTSNNFQITLTGNTTLQNPTNVASGQAGIVTIIQGTGGNTMAFGSNWNYPGGSGSTPSLTSTSGARDVLAYYSISATQIAYRLVQDIKA